jgi:hypothetical protein
MHTIRFSSFALAFAAACGSQSALVGERYEQIDTPRDGGVASATHSDLDGANPHEEGSTVVSDNEHSSTTTSTVDTGDPAPTTSNELVPTSDGAQTVDDGSGCEDFVYEAKTQYEVWVATLNDWSPLAGTTFEGYVEGGPDLTLRINADQSATLIVGEAAPAPVADQAYLCEPLFEGLNCDVRSLLPGGTYPLHGATLDGARLRAPVQMTSAFDTWCELQTPIPWNDNCYYSVDSPAGYSFSDGFCTVDGLEVDCGWMFLSKADVCACTSEECFASVYSETPGIDARLSDDGLELQGSIGSAPVYLSRTDG